MSYFGLYVFDEDGQPVPTDDMQAWGAFMERPGSRRVAHTEVFPGVHVSTVFLGLDHNFHGDGPPILWETMILVGESWAPNPERMRRVMDAMRRYLRGEPAEVPERPDPEHPLDQEQWRWSSREEALAGHEHAVALVRAEHAFRLEHTQALDDFLNNPP